MSAWVRTAASASSSHSACGRTPRRASCDSSCVSCFASFCSGPVAAAAADAASAAAAALLEGAAARRGARRRAGAARWRAAADAACGSRGEGGGAVLV